MVLSLTRLENSWAEPLMRRFIYKIVNGRIVTLANLRFRRVSSNKEDFTLHPIFDYACFMDARIETKRLMLRHVTLADVDVIQACIHDPRIYEKVASIPPDQPRQVTIDWISTHADGRKAKTDYVYAITSQDKFLGLIGFHRGSISGLFDLGFWVSPEGWGKGYATEAATALLSHLEARMGAQKTTAGYFTDNPASGRVLEKLGYIRMGEDRMHCAGRDKTLPPIKLVRVASP